MRDQVGSITAMGITATYISDKETAGSKERKQAIKNGMFQIVFISPEALILLKWRNMLSNKVYRDNLVAFVVDEAHCIKKWYANGGICVMVIIFEVVVLRGESFRKEFSDLGEIRSIVPRHVRLMALTTTATLSTRKFIDVHHSIFKVVGGPLGLCEIFPKCPLNEMMKTNDLIIESTKYNNSIHSTFTYQPIHYWLKSFRNTSYWFISHKIYNVIF